MAGTLWIRFYGHLNDLVRFTPSGRCHEVKLLQPVAVRDAIERLGVPHTEVALLLVDGESVPLSFPVGGGEHVSVFPPFCSLDISGLPRVPHLAPPGAPRFIVDGHLGTLARLLRMLGMDTAYAHGAGDESIAAAAHDESRIVLTRDRGLLKRSAVVFGCLIRSTDPEAQAIQVLRRYSLASVARPLTRCIACNGELVKVSKADIDGALQPGTRQHYDVFQRCSVCGQVYWDGPHVAHMRCRIRALLEEDARAGR